MRDITHLPEPDRALKNIESFLAEHPEHAAAIDANYDRVAALFSFSQFLANYAAQNPLSLLNALSSLDIRLETEVLRAELSSLLNACENMQQGMRVIRRFRKDMQIGITIRDIMHMAPLQEIMLEMSNLADAVLAESLLFVERILQQRYGVPEDNAFAVMALGKLGAQELNYSSDVDIIFIYRQDGETSGTEGLSGMVMNRVSAFEYYIKLSEEFSKFLSKNTEDGFAYRVDLRLRPEGERGALALTIRQYEDYYESWGQLWEKAALLRTRFVAGNEELGSEFIAAVRPFIYRKYLDLDSIDEIRRMKSQVEQLKPGTFSRDIKRGYGGIREVEFFIQIFQLMYGGKEPALRERSTLKALHRLVQKGLIGHNDQGALSDNYVYLRTLEHRIQQMNDLQTHSLPSGDAELEIVARKMGFASREDFLHDLEGRRNLVRSIYDSLFQGQTAVAHEEGEGLLSRIFWDAAVPRKQELEEALISRGIKETDKAVHYLMQIRNNIYSFQTIRGRRLLEEIVPRFVDKALEGDNPVAALLQIAGFSRLLAASESYMEPIVQRPELIESFNFVFSHSNYLSKVLMSNTEYMESLMQVSIRHKSVATSIKELELLVERKGEQSAIRLYRRLEEIRLGILFLNREIDVQGLMQGISMVADAILCYLTAHHSRALAVAGFGKLGGREIIFNSDLDIIFFTADSATEDDAKDAERILKLLMSYTKEGVAYKIDTRLRPDGSKGPLVSSIAGLGGYYAANAQTWELQALLKARPLSTSAHANRAFIKMRRRALAERGSEMTLAEILHMRDRIKKELSKDAARAGSYDIKLGAGGLEDLEFAVQYLQLKNAAAIPGATSQNTLKAIERLGRRAVISSGQVNALRQAYLFYRTIETGLRLSDEALLKAEGDSINSVASLLNIPAEQVVEELNSHRRLVSLFIEGLS